MFCISTNGAIYLKVCHNKQPNKCEAYPTTITVYLSDYLRFSEHSSDLDTAGAERFNQTYKADNLAKISGLGSSHSQIEFYDMSA